MSLPITVQGAADDIDLETARQLVESGGASVVGPGDLALTTYQERAHLGGLPISPILGGTLGNKEFRKDAILTYSVMKTIAVRSSAVAPAINFVCETLGSTPFEIKSIDGQRVPQRDIKRATELFTQPMGAGMGTFPDLLTELCFDQMAMDHGILLKHGDLDAFEAMAGETFVPLPDKRGRLKSWEQQLEGDKAPEKFTREEIAFFKRRPRTDSLYGRPPMEACIQEIKALLNASKMFAYSMDRNEVPPGVLVMLNQAGGGDTARRRFLRQMQEDPGYAQHYKMRVLGGSNLKDVKWIDFSKNFHDMEVAILMREIQAIVWRNFGVDRLAMGAAQDINRSTAEAMVTTRHYSLFKPILDLWANKFTFEVLSAINPNLFIEFIHFARTGDENDLRDEAGGPGVVVRPTSRACGGCKGLGWISFKDEGGRVADQCPRCHGKATTGPLFISRPSFARVVVNSSAGPTPDDLRDPDRAWSLLGAPEQRSRLDREVMEAQEKLQKRLEDVETYHDLMGAGRYARDILTKLFDKAFTLGADIVRKSGNEPNPRPIREARAAIYEVVRFEMQDTAASVLSQYDDPSTEGVQGMAERALVSLSHLSSMAPRLAGLAISSQFE